MITRSLALPSLFPATQHDFGELSRVLRRLQGRGFGMVELYTAPGHDDALAALLRETGLASILIGVLALKGAGHSLCAVEEAERQRAVAVLRDCIDRAAAIGARAVMVNSGFLPKDGARIGDACGAYVRSIGEGYDHIRARGYDLQITLEPGDSCVQSFQLLGPTARVIETAAAIRVAYPGYALTMDVAHLREEGEDIMAALEAALPYCNHVHLCNCLMDDPSHPMYGDKHVDFDYPGACFGYDDFARMYRQVWALYGARDCIITLEIQCRAADNDAWFDEVTRRCAWLMEEDA